MDGYERLYEEVERATVKFVGFVTDLARYDFGIIYTNQFFGKPLVICMQTGKSTLLCAEEASNIDHLLTTFQLSDPGEGEKLAEFFRHQLPFPSLLSQYE
ncbi:DUF3055 domain-containing protein [Caldalkalibacillus salinus]|uniref:DUF3055 domain-containing protein n=1 Tax=Caldalkalibacillus salinus TaxID=2803787 RepID=UPI001920CFEB|nr:DUF3055 domain-containing protein [Caldalkalibacillus salinus]